MWYNLIFALILFLIAFIGFTGYTLAKDNNNDSALNQLSKIEYANKLEQLPQNSDGWDKPVGAMCYKVAAPPERAEYVCPKCGEMTLYPTYSDEGFRVSEITYLRNLVKKITKIDVKLDDSELCSKCNPKAKIRELCLIVKKDKNSKSHRTCGITAQDINLLYDYSVGKNPSKADKDRLEELLGIEKDNGK